MAHIAMWLAVVLGVALLAFVRASNPAVRRTAGAAFAVVSFAACVCWLGLFEGAYNHGLKSLLGIVGVTGPTFDLFFPPRIYEPPGDLGFEVSGVLQLPVGLLAGHYARLVPRVARESN